MTSNDRHRSLFGNLDRIVILSGAMLALGGCSLLFAPSRYEGGDPRPEDAGSSVDASLDGGGGPEDASTDAPVPMGDDAFVPSCDGPEDCEPGQYCDMPRGMPSVCRSCDADGDGLVARECAAMMQLYDCDPATAPAPTTVSTDADVQDTLRVFSVGASTHVFWRNSEGGMRIRLPTESSASPLEHRPMGGSPRHVLAFDAVRNEADVIVAGYTIFEAVSYRAVSTGLEVGSTREFGALPSPEFASVRPSGPATLLFSRDTPHLAFSATYGSSTQGRLVVGVGGFHVARFHADVSSPTNFLAASSGRVAVLPADGDDRRSMLLWNGDLRSASDMARVPLIAFPPTTALGASETIRQAAIAASDSASGMPTAREVVALLGTSEGRLVAMHFRCPDDTNMPCLNSDGAASYTMAGAHPGVVAMATMPGSTTQMLVATSHATGFELASLNLDAGRGEVRLPMSLASVARLPAPALAETPRAMAMDITLDAMGERAMLTLARAAGRQVQVLRIEACVVPTGGG